MLRSLGKPSPAMVVACIALASALSGVGYAQVAVPQNTVAQLPAGLVGWAAVKADGSLAGSQGVVATFHRSPASYRIQFGVNLRRCAVFATPNQGGTAVTAYAYAPAPRQVLVTVTSTAGGGYDAPFSVAAYC